MKNEPVMYGKHRVRKRSLYDYVDDDDDDDDE